MIKLVVAQSYQRGNWWIDRNKVTFVDPAGRFRRPAIVCTPQDVDRCRGLHLHRHEVVLLDDLDVRVLAMIESLMRPGNLSKAAQKKLLSNLLTLRRKLNTGGS